MSSYQLDEEQIFQVARKIPEADARSQYLDQICAFDQGLRERVEALLKIQEAPDFLRSENGNTFKTVDLGSPLERPGMTIGRYKLMEQIGEGGMGSVFVAQQDRPIRRKVALKVIKPGMDSKVVIARFEAERQALALMDHPNIAKVLDAGTTDSGRPYFAMELVKGVPITDYCDQNRLTIPERLELFVQVCQAIQHAHQKGIIHRDIKPSNVLVTLHDGKPVPKVIDFGVAKALNSKLTDKTIYTEHLQVIGTLLYMSPEQAELSGLDIDTRSDIYSLGVLLYELLTGTTPFTHEELSKAGFDEQRRIIKERCPQKASTRISSLGESATVIAKNRKSEPRKLNQLIHGDLDWIVMQAIEKDRTRRYETASEFADDVERYLRKEPVEACPPNTIYVVRKFVARHRQIVSLGVISVATLCIISALAVIIAVRAMQYSRELAKTIDALKKEKLTNDALLDELGVKLREEAIVAAFSGERELAVSSITTAVQVGIEPEWEHIVSAILDHSEGKTTDALVHAQAAVAKNDQSIPALGVLAMTQLYSGNADDFFRSVTGLEIKKPASPEDYLFKGYALIYIDSQQACQMIHHAVEEKRTWAIARAMYAEALAQRCLDFDQIEDAESAIWQSRVAAELKPDNLYVLAMSMHAYHVALRRAKKLGLPSGDGWEPNARRLAEKIESRDSFVLANFFRAELYAYLDKHEEAEKAMRRNLSTEAGRVFKSYLSGYLYARGDTEGALEIRPWQGTPLMFADARNGIERARQAYETLEKGESFQMSIWRVTYPALLGDRNSAIQTWKQLYANSTFPSKIWQFRRPLSIFSEAVDPEDLLAEEQIPNIEKAGICYYAGIKSLIDGERDKAEVYFQRVVDYDVFTDTIRYFAVGYRTRMKNDSSWPSFDRTAWEESAK